jgi:hypothetical protein
MCQNHKYQNPRSHTTRILRASPTCSSLFIARCSKASVGGFLRLLSCPRSIFFVDLSSSIFSFNGSLSLTSLLLFFFFDHFDPFSVYVPSTLFILQLSSLILASFLNQGPIGPQHSHVTRPKSLQE